MHFNAIKHDNQASHVHVIIPTGRWEYGESYTQSAKIAPQFGDLISNIGTQKVIHCIKLIKYCVDLMYNIIVRNALFVEILK